MTRLALLLMALGACSDPGGNPIGGGGPPTTGDDDDDSADASVGPDSGGPISDAAPFVDAIVGRMCQADSLLAPEACPAGADFTDITAAHIEAGSTDQADAAGNFELPSVPGGSTVATLRLAPGDANYRLSVIPIALRPDGTAGPITLPVMLQEDWFTLTNALGLIDVAGDGAIVIYTVDGSSSLSGAYVIGGGSDEVYYDNGAPLEWDQDIAGTDTDGVILIRGVSGVGSPTRTVTLQQADRIKTIVGVPLEEDAITFMTADFGE